MNIFNKLIHSLIHSCGYRLEKIKKERVLYRAHFRGNQLLCFKGDPLTEEILTGLGWDNQLPEILKIFQHEAKGDVLEVGANIGAGFPTLAAQFPHLQFHCFEPVPYFFDVLKENVTTYRASNVQLYNKAFNEAGGIIQIQVSLGTAGSVKPGSTEEIIEREAMTIDQFSHDKNIKLIKIDVDGHEMSVLQGAHQTISTMRPYVFMEFDLKIMKKMNVNPTDLFKIFMDNHYHSIKIWDNFSHFIKETSDWNELIQISNSIEHYTNILLVPNSATPHSN